MIKTHSIEVITPENYRQATHSPDLIADFLYEHLDQFGDPREHIMRCLNYALGITPARRGFIVTAAEVDNKLLGVAVMCETDMGGFVPENLLVYIAVDAKARGRGIGKALMQQSVDAANGDVALHVEPDNPARHLYERIGFTHKYLEMRFKK